jgi:hypothetical protein
MDPGVALDVRLWKTGAGARGGAGVHFFWGLEKITPVIQAMY